VTPSILLLAIAGDDDDGAEACVDEEATTAPMRLLRLLRLLRLRACAPSGAAPWSRQA
jgi:hypothetical protein